MKCKQCKDLMIVRIYGSLDTRQENVLEKHLQQCCECQQIFLSMKDHKRILAIKDPEKEPDWDRSWQIIAGKAIKREQGRRSLFPVPQPVLVAISLVIVFVLGFLAGKRFLFDPSGKQPSQIPAIRQAESPLRNFADTLEPLLIGFLNRTSSAYLSEARELQRIETLVVQDMLIQTRLLRQLISEENDPHLWELLDDLELVLRTMANLRPDDQESLNQLQTVIREKEIKLKLRTLLSSQSLL